MIFEKAKFAIDIQQMRKDVEFVRANFPPHLVSSGYGGWSITSSTGLYTDGWLKSGVQYERISKDMSPDDYSKFVREAGQSRPVLEYVKPTEICTPYFSSLIESWKEMGLYPCRVRLTLLKPSAGTTWHQDAPDWLYSVRLHIPIETNDGCLFETRTEANHIPADGSVYFVAVNNTHRVINRGTADRIHLIANVFDTKKVTEFHQYTDASRTGGSKALVE